MNKHWAALLLAIVATQAVADEKEYTIKNCGKQEHIKMQDAYNIRNCNNCENFENFKISFHVSKELKSIMRTYTTAGGDNIINIRENCKIFDTNNFECKDRFHELIVSNGKWEETTIFVDLKIGEISAIYYECGYEIKKIFNFFK